MEGVGDIGVGDFFCIGAATDFGIGIGEVATDGRSGPYPTFDFSFDYTDSLCILAQPKISAADTLASLRFCDQLVAFERRFLITMRGEKNPGKVLARVLRERIAYFAPRASTEEPRRTGQGAAEDTSRNHRRSLNDLALVPIAR